MFYLKNSSEDGAGNVIFHLICKKVEYLKPLTTSVHFLIDKMLEYPLEYNQPNHKLKEEHSQSSPQLVQDDLAWCRP